jgi:hypothetical protein
MGVAQQITIVKRLIRSVDEIDNRKTRCEIRPDLGQRRFKILCRIVRGVERLVSVRMTSRPTGDDRKVYILARKTQNEGSQRVGTEPGIDEGPRG